MNWGSPGLCGVMLAILLGSSQSQEKRLVCSGSANGIGNSQNSPAKEIQNLRDMYENCTLVTGNLEIVGVNRRHYQEANITSLDFLGSIEEVTGYVLVAYNEIEFISLPKLKIIRGETLFTNHDGEQQSLLVFLNPRLKEFSMPSLRVIQAGGVKVLQNEKLCYWDSLDWNQTLSSEQSVEIQGSFKQCYAEGNGSIQKSSVCGQCVFPHCWGPASHQCQIIYRNGCPARCSNRMCHNGECCDIACAGGCTGPTSRDCVGCLDFRKGSNCVQQCPSPTRYNAVTRMKEKNVHGMYHLSHECVKECPKNMVIDGDSCVSRCAEGFMVKAFERSPGVTSRECVQCEKFCPKTCVITEKVSMENIHNFTNCTVVDGFIEIRQNAFEDKNMSLALTMADLSALNSVQVVTQYVFIQLSDPSFRSLRFLKNLERIEGRGLFKNEFALYISHTSLYSLDLLSLTEVMGGSLYMNTNSELCYVHNIPWDRIVAEKAKKWKMDNPYRHPEICKKFGNVCNSMCNATLGCWGPASDSCYECRDWKLDGVCTSSCLPEEGKYMLNETTKICEMCHPQCKDGCSGPLATDCHGCQNVRQDGECVEKCKGSRYVDIDSICQTCHDGCALAHGCSGPSDILGDGGCNKCHHALLSDDGQKVEKCLARDVVHFPTCKGYSSHFVHTPDTEYLTKSVAHEVCKKCHPACTSCTGYGTSRLQNRCECAKLTNREGTTCYDVCPHHMYRRPPPMLGIGWCLPCHPECHECWSGSNSSCHACQNFRINDVVNQTKFYCVGECPPEQSFPNAQRICSVPKKTFNREQITRVAASVAGVFLVVLIVAASVIVYFRKRLAVIEQKVEEEEHEFLEKPPPPICDPDLSKLIIIAENHLDCQSLMGTGAFGDVYKGTYSPPSVKGKKLPVAIKVIKDENKEASAISEILDEAKIMASMEHRHLVRLVGICIANHVMLITPLMPMGNLLDFVHAYRSKLTSKVLLTWGQQIAEGMAYLEDHRLVHRDLAARNVLVKKPMLVKITDFGLAKMLNLGEEFYKSRAGKMPVRWLAIECLKHGRFTPKSDVWAFGVTMWELFTFGERPYADVSMEDIQQILEKGERLPQPSICTIDVFLIIVKCWMTDPVSRPNFLDLAEAFARMRADPARYLVIPGESDNEKLIRMESYTVEENRRILRNLVDLDVDEMLEEEEYYRDESEPNSPTSPSKPLLENVDRRSMMNMGHRTPSTGSQRYGPEPRRKQSKNSKASSHINDADNYLVPNTLAVGPDSPGSSASFVPYTMVISGSPSEADCRGSADLPHEYSNDPMSAVTDDYLTPNSLLGGRLPSTDSYGCDNNEYLQSPRLLDKANTPLLRKPLLPSQFFDEAFMEKESTV